MFRFIVLFNFNRFANNKILGQSFFNEPKGLILFKLMMWLFFLFCWLSSNFQSFLTLWINFYFFQIVLETFSFIFSQIYFLFSFKCLKQLCQSFLLDFLNSNWFLNLCRIFLNFFFVIFQHFNHFFLDIFVNLRSFKLTLNLIFKKPLSTKQIMWSKVFNRAILNSTFRAFVFWINLFADNTF